MAWGVLATQVPDTPAPSAWANQVKANFEATLGGDLSGSLPNPTIAAGAVTEAKVAAAIKDGAAATPSMRTLGTGAAQACAGNDARLSDQRTPTDNSVTSAKIVNGTIVDADIASNAAIAVTKIGSNDQRWCVVYRSSNQSIP